MAEQTEQQGYSWVWGNLDNWYAKFLITIGALLILAFLISHL